MSYKVFTKINIKLLKGKIFIKLNIKVLKANYHNLLY